MLEQFDRGSYLREKAVGKRVSPGASAPVALIGLVPETSIPVDLEVVEDRECLRAVSENHCLIGVRLKLEFCSVSSRFGLSAWFKYSLEETITEVRG